MSPPGSDSRQNRLRSYLDWARTATRWAIAALVVSIPGCAQVEFDLASPGGGSDPTPAWAVPFIIVGFLAALALVGLVISRLAVGLALVVRDGPGAFRSVEGETGLFPGAQKEGWIMRVLLSAAIPVTYVGLALAVDTSGSRWVFPDPDVGVQGMVVASAGMALLLTGLRSEWNRRRRRESQD